MRLLVSTAEPMSAERLRSVAGELPDDAEVVVVAPEAVEDVLQTFPADRVVVIEHEPDAHDYREDDRVASGLRERFGLPVDVATVSREG